MHKKRKWKLLKPKMRNLDLKSKQDIYLYLNYENNYRIPILNVQLFRQKSQKLTRKYGLKPSDWRNWRKKLLKLTIVVDQLNFKVKNLINKNRLM